MKQKLFLLLLSTVFSISLYGQTLKISLTGDWPENVTGQLVSYHLTEEIILSKINLGETLITIPDTIPKGMFQLQLSQYGQVSFVKKIIWNKHSFEINIHNKDFQITTNWVNTDINPRYEQFLKAKDSLQTRIQTIQKILTLYSDTNSNFYSVAVKERDKNIVRVNKQTDVFCNLLSKTPAAQIAAATRPITPNYNEVIRAQLMYLHNNFFNHYNPLNEAIVNSPIYKAKLNEYLSLVFELSKHDNEIEETLLIKYINTYLKVIMKNEDVVTATCQYLRKLMHKQGLEKAEAHIDIVYLSQQCNAEDDIDLQKRLEQYKKLAVGNLAPKIEWIDKKGQSKSLYNLKSKYTVVVFWASWCEHCKEVLPEIHNYLKSKEETQVVSIGLDNDKIPWKQEKAKYGAWNHIQGVGQWENPIAKEYAVYATPTLFVLDSNKKIVGKCKNLLEIKQLL